nr:D-amino-acid transaminase, chloroplastic-like isoform X1 [Ipomoea batatas]
MASLSSLTKPMPETSIFLKNLNNQPPRSLVFPKNLSIGHRPFSFGSFEAQTIQTSDVTLLSCSQAIERLRASRESYPSKQQYLAMYSSIFGGIVTDTAAMVIPMDDHIVHRGHGVFDTAAIVDGYLYELDQHVERFLRSAAMAKIKPPFDKESIRKILIQTVSASKCKTGSLRYWLSTGPGDFQLSPSHCHLSALYAIVIQDQSPPDHRGVKVITSSIPIKPPQFAVMKSVNYLPNALSKMEAEENGAYAAIWLDGDGFVAEGPNMNVAFVTKEKELLMPSFDKILSGCTAKRVLVLAQGLVKQGKLRSIRVEHVRVDEGKRAEEIMLIGSGVLVRPVLQWDDQVIGDVCFMQSHDLTGKFDVAASLAARCQPRVSAASPNAIDQAAIKGNFG